MFNITAHFGMAADHKACFCETTKGLFCFIGKGQEYFIYSLFPFYISHASALFMPSNIPANLINHPPVSGKKIINA